MSEKMVPLCRCNNCMRLYIDTNPKSDIVKFKVPHTTRILTDNSECPVCETDMYLSDVGLRVNAEKFYLAGEIDSELPIISELLNWCDKGIKQADTSDYPIDREMFVHFKSIIIRTMDEKI